MLPAEARIDLDALRANAAFVRRLAGSRETIAVVKANAYGHGAADVARVLVEAGCARLAVLTVPEGEALRGAGIGAPMLVLAGARDASEAEGAIRLGLTPVLHHAESLALVAEAARAAGQRAAVHVEVDTGLHRMGVPPESAARFLCDLAARDEIELEGVFTHFSAADEEDLAPTLEQIARFREVLRTAHEAGVSAPIVHAENSAALMAGDVVAKALPEATAVRPGLMLYGARPAPHLVAPLEPVMTFAATVLSVRAVKAGAGVGYGGAFVAPAGGTRVATLSVGYEDGVPRTSSGRGHVWLAGARRPIVGRVSMDSIAVEIAGDVQVDVGDEAVFFGRSDAAGAGEAGAGIPVEEAAEAAGTLAYELMVRVGDRVPRTLVGAAPQG